MQENEENYYIFQRNLQLQGYGKPQRYRCRFYYCVKRLSIDFSRTIRGLQLCHPQISQLLNHSQLFYIDPREQTNYFLGNYPLEEEAFVLFDNWATLVITVSFRRQVQPLPPQELPALKSTRKSKERTVQEAMRCMTQWREEVERSSINGKPLSLVAAAKAIGMSKKTLDDYARWIKLGEALGFDFQKSGGEKFSLLRNFVKERKKQREVELEDPDLYWDVEEMGRVNDDEQLE